MCNFDNNKDRPAWIRGRIKWDASSDKVRSVMGKYALNSVCEEAACPNRGKCWQAGHVTFMILGRVCTRGCLFCNVSGGEPSSPDEGEAARIARAVKDLGARYVVITSVTRDDLSDGGTGQFVDTVNCLKRPEKGPLIELLIPDMYGETDLLKDIAFSGADVIGHNIEVPERLYGLTRPKADYQRSLGVLRTLAGFKVSGADILVKSAMILGVGETYGEVLECLKDLNDAGTDIVYMGQYLSPTGRNWPVKKYYSPDEFKDLSDEAMKMGFRAVVSGPMVRSSYFAEKAYEQAISCKL